MAITTERYVPDSGRIMIDGVDQSGSVITVSPAAPRRTTREIFTLGGKATEAQTRAKAGNYEVQMRIMDDRSLANDATGAMKALFDAYNGNTSMTSLTVAPAGSTIGMSEYTYANPEVVQCPPHSNMDADTEEEAAVDVVITATGVSAAAIV